VQSEQILRSVIDEQKIGLHNSADDNGVPSKIGCLGRADE